MAIISVIIGDMRKFAALIIVVLFISAFIFFNRSQPKQTITQTPPATSPSFQDEKVDLKASFTILTKGTTRIFTDKKYHNLSEDVYLEASDSSIIHVKRKGITYDDFFETLPMKLTKDCLTTGTGQVFCTGQNGTLRFYLNDVEDKDLLDKEIRDKDKILIEFK